MDVEVTVASKQSERLSDAPGVISVTTKEDIEMFGARDLYQVLERMPSVFMTGSYLFPNNLVSLRGDLPTHTNNHTLILINGRPVRESNSGGLNMMMLMGYPVEMIERIEVIRGPGSVIYGTNAFTGVVNVVTVRGKQDSLRLKGEGGSYGYYRTSLSSSAEKDDFTINGTVSTMREDGWDRAGFDEQGILGRQAIGHHSWAGATALTLT